MDHAQISWNVVEILTPYLPALLDKQVMTANADQTEQLAYRLWEIIYPKISMRPTVMNAVRDLAAQNNSRNRNALTMEIASIFLVNQYFADDVALTLEGKHKEIDRTNRDTSEQLAPKVTLVDREVPDAKRKLVCQECGRADETVRFVNYPYVVSIVFLTFRRSFSGLYCEKHARKYFLFAVVITAAIGWLGIPFGIIFAPVALFSLLRADRKMDPVNAKVQKQIAEAKLDADDREGAIKSIKKSLYFEVSNEALDMVKQIGGKNFLEDPPSLLRQFLTLLGLLVGSLLIGLVLGIFDVLINIPFNNLTTSSLILAVLSWIPMVIILYLGGFLVALVVSESARQARIESRFLAGFYGVVCSLLVSYSVNTGNFLISIIYYSGFENMSIGQGFVYFIETLFNGGWYSLSNLIEFNYTVDVIWFTIFILGLFITVYLAAREAIKTANWNIVLRSLTTAGSSRYSNTSIIGWGTLAAFLITFSLFVFALTPLGLSASDSELQANLDELYALLDAGEFEQARVAADAVLLDYPENLDALYALGLIYLSEEDCSAAIDSLSAGLENSSGVYVPAFQYGLGTAYLCVGDLESTEENLLSAKDAYAEDVMLLYILGITYYRMGDYQSAAHQFEEMIDYESNWATPYAYLALSYANLEDQQASDEALEQALSLAEPVENDYYSLATFYLEVGEFSMADEYFSLGMEAFPSDSDYLYGKIWSLLARGELDQAEDLFDQNDQRLSKDQDFYRMSESLLMERGEFDEALQILQLLEESYSYDMMLVSYALTEKAYIYVNYGDYQKAREFTEQAVEIQPYNMSAYSFLSLVNYELGNKSSACEQAQYVDEKNPLRAIQHYVLGLCAMDAGDDAQAINEFELYLSYSWNLNQTRMFYEQAEIYLESLRGN